jgi:hypothetical protein
MEENVTFVSDGVTLEGLFEKALSLWNPKAHLEVIEGADHFSAGHAD